MRIFSTTSLLLIISLGLWTLGCEDENKVTAEILTISPGDGETNVSKTSAIQIQFSESMDMQSCESRFGLHIGELIEMPMMDNMNGYIPGQFHWNTDQTVMMFHPDSTLMDSTMYSICLEDGMMSDEHGSMGMMMQVMSEHGMEIIGGIITHFKTE